MLDVTHVPVLNLTALDIIRYSFGNLKWGSEEGAKAVATGITDLMPSLAAVVNIQSKLFTYGRALSNPPFRGSDKLVIVMPGWFSTGCGDVLSSQQSSTLTDETWPPDNEFTSFLMLLKTSSLIHVMSLCISCNVLMISR